MSSKLSGCDDDFWSCCDDNFWSRCDDDFSSCRAPNIVSSWSRSFCIRELRSPSQNTQSNRDVTSSTDNHQHCHHHHHHQQQQQQQSHLIYSETVTAKIYGFRSAIAIAGCHQFMYITIVNLEVSINQSINQSISQWVSQSITDSSSSGPLWQVSEWSLCSTVTSMVHVHCLMD